MSGGHHHGPSGHAGATHRGRLAAAFVITVVFAVVEVVGGLVSGSLALLGDAGHVSADAVALGAALLATRIAVRPDRTGRRTFGSYRAEVFAAGLSVLIMVAVAVLVTVEAVGRLTTDHPSGPPAGLVMLVVGAVGLVVNLVALVLLRGGAQESLNVRGAYLEVLADAAGSVGVLLAGLLVAVTGLAWWDSVVALLVAVFIVVRAVVLGREVLAVLGQHAPSGMDPDEVAGALAGVGGVAAVHDLHLWTLTSGMNVATAHLVTSTDHPVAEVLTAARTVLRARFGIEHATLQVEPLGLDCGDPSW